MHYESSTDDEGSGSYDWSFSGSFSSYDQSYTENSEWTHADEDYDASLDLACGFNFQNEFWLAGGFSNSRQVCISFI